MTQVSSPQNISKRWLTAVFRRFVHVVPSRNGTVVMTIMVIAASVIMTTVRELVVGR